MVYIGVVWARRTRYLRNEMGEVMGVRGKREGWGVGENRSKRKNGRGARWLDKSCELRRVVKVPG
jgi:hypothetical protein